MALATHWSSKAVLQRVDGEMDVQIKLKLLSCGVTVANIYRDAFVPELKEYLVVSVIEWAHKVFL